MATRLDQTQQKHKQVYPMYGVRVRRMMRMKLKTMKGRRSSFWNPGLSETRVGGVLRHRVSKPWARRWFCRGLRLQGAGNLTSNQSDALRVNAGSRPINGSQQTFLQCILLRLHAMCMCRSYSACHFPRLTSSCDGHGGVPVYGLVRDDNNTEPAYDP
jgi:hypothetical protein